MKFDNMVNLDFLMCKIFEEFLAPHQVAFPRFRQSWKFCDLKKISYSLKIFVEYAIKRNSNAITNNFMA